ncbi:MAG: hypothetical protein II304_12315 [Bacteroidales bacterium]|nr:hypothetical protein [Bacteroidales bacterium]
MKAQDYLEITNDLREATWDIEDANDTRTDFSEDRFHMLRKLCRHCENLIAEFENYKKLRGKE